MPYFIWTNKKFRNDKSVIKNDKRNDNLRGMI